MKLTLFVVDLPGDCCRHSRVPESVEATLRVDWGVPRVAGQEKAPDEAHAALLLETRPGLQRRLEEAEGEVMPTTKARGRSRIDLHRPARDLQPSIIEEGLQSKRSSWTSKCV